MKKTYSYSKKVYILFIGAFLFLLLGTIAGLRKGDVLLSVIFGLSALILFAFTFVLHNQMIVITDEGIETYAFITKKLSWIRKVAWGDIIKIEEDHFWDILTLLYIFIYDRMKGCEKLGLSLNMIANYKNHQDLVQEIFNRIPPTARRIGKFDYLLPKHLRNKPHSIFSLTSIGLLIALLGVLITFSLHFIGIANIIVNPASYVIIAIGIFLIFLGLYNRDLSK